MKSTSYEREELHCATTVERRIDGRRCGTPRPGGEPASPHAAASARSRARSAGLPAPGEPTNPGVLGTLAGSGTSCGAELMKYDDGPYSAPAPALEPGREAGEPMLNAPRPISTAGRRIPVLS